MHRDPARVAAEPGDVLAHPAQGRDLVKEASLAGRLESAAGHIGQVQEPKRAEPVVERHHDESVPGQHRAIARNLVRAGAGRVSAAMDPDQYGIATRTGGGAAGRVTFTRRQSSLRCSVWRAPAIGSRSLCQATGPGSIAALTPDHGLTGWGGRKRSAPAGASAYRMPRQTSRSPAASPRIRPAAVSTAV